METREYLTVLQLVLAVGVLQALAEAVKWRLNSRSRHSEEQNVVAERARRVQEMSLDLIKPLHEELTRANNQVENLRREAETTISELRTVRAELDHVATWALAAKELLDHHEINYPPVPPILRQVR